MSYAFRRGQLKASLTKFQTFLDDFTDSPVNQSRLQQRVDNLKAIFQALPLITEKLMELDPKLESGDHAQIEFEMMERYMDLLAAADIKKHQNARPSSSTTSSAVQVINSVDQTLTRIPKLELRKFDGKLEEWKSFSHWFISNIHDRAGITDCMRMSYLQDTLVGEAAKTIAGLEPTNENYKEAWELLETTYNNEEAIIARHFELLAAIPKLQNNSGDTIRQLINETLVHVRSMKVLGEPTDHWNTPLLYHTLSKLDNITKREWQRQKKGSTKRTFNDLITFLREEAMKSQSIATKETKPLKINNKKDVSGDKNSKSKQALTTIVFKNCPICSEDGHATYRCGKLLNMSIPQRIDAVKTANLCFNCLRANHRTNECRKGNCFKCGKVHHTILHLNRPEEGEQRKD